MVRVLCYGHKSYKFKSYTRLSLIDYICTNNVIKIFANRDMFVKGLHFDCKSNLRGSIPPCLFIVPLLLA